MKSIHLAAFAAALLVLTAPLPVAGAAKPPAAPTCQTPDVKKQITALEAKLAKLQSEIGDLQTNFEGAGEFLAQPGLTPAQKKDGEAQQARLGKEIDANGAATQDTQAKLDKLKALKAC